MSQVTDCAGAGSKTVKVTQHREKQFYSSLTDTPRAIVDAQAVTGVDTTSGATITSEADHQRDGQIARQSSRVMDPLDMRLDWYLPVIRKPRPEDDPPPRSRVACGSREDCFPAGCSPIGRPRNAASCGASCGGWDCPGWRPPVGRIMQAVCFVTFLTLFFYVCWPYDAGLLRVGAGGIRRKWTHRFRPSGRRLGNGSSGIRRPPGAALYVTDETLGTPTAPAPVWEFSLREPSADGLVLEPAREFPLDVLDQLSVSTGPWTLHERHPQTWPSHYADSLARKETLAAEIFLVIDPLVSLSTGIASRSWVWSLSCAAVILAVCVLIPRGFCGYLCPLGTLIDLFDTTIGKHVTRFRVSGEGWWVHIKYYLLLGVLVAAVCGVLVSGYVRSHSRSSPAGCCLRSSHLCRTALSMGGIRCRQSPGATSISLSRCSPPCSDWDCCDPRFWCKYVCPSGAVFSLGNLLRVSERKVESSCIHCDKCIEICPFDAIKAGLHDSHDGLHAMPVAVRASVRPMRSSLSGRWEDDDLKPFNDPPTQRDITRAAWDF